MAISLLVFVIAVPNLARQSESMPRTGKCGKPQRERTLLALGIIGIPSEQAKRQYIRGWLRAANTGAAPSSQHGPVLEHRFALGTKQLRGISQQALRREHAEQGDLALLTEQRESKNHLSEKTLRWFVHAAELFPCAHFIGKADPVSALLRTLTLTLTLTLTPTLTLTLTLTRTRSSCGIASASSCASSSPADAPSTGDSSWALASTGRQW